MSLISLVLPGTQGDCKVTAERMAQRKERYKMEGGMPSFSLAFVWFMGPSKESVLFSKNSLRIWYTITIVLPFLESQRNGIIQQNKWINEQINSRIQVWNLFVGNFSITEEGLLENESTEESRVERKDILQTSLCGHLNSATPEGTATSEWYTWASKHFLCY
jgi:hypothetical protein